jgi:hypothetical protein
MTSREGWDDLPDSLQGDDVDDFFRPAERGTFAMVPAWLIGTVTPAAFEIYAGLARTVNTGTRGKGPGDWFGYLSRDEYGKRYRPVKADTWKRSLAELESVGAVLLFHTRTRARVQKVTGKPIGGQQGPWAFYLSPESTPMLGPWHVDQPRRLAVRFSSMIPRRSDVTMEQCGDRGTVYADEKPARKATASPGRDAKGRFARRPDADMGNPGIPARTARGEPWESIPDADMGHREREPLLNDTPLSEREPAPSCQTCHDEPGAFGSGYCPACDRTALDATAPETRTERIA